MTEAEWLERSEFSFRGITMLASDNFSDTFWELVEQTGGNEKKLRTILASLSREALIMFYKESRRAMRSVWNTSDASGWLRPKKLEDQISEDAKEDIFAYVVSKGRDYYNAIVSRRKRLRRNIDPGDVPIIWVPGQVFHERFGEEISRQ